MPSQCLVNVPGTDQILARSRWGTPCAACWGALSLSAMCMLGRTLRRIHLSAMWAGPCAVCHGDAMGMPWGCHGDAMGRTLRSIVCPYHTVGRTLRSIDESLARTGLEYIDVVRGPGQGRAQGSQGGSQGSARRQHLLSPIIAHARKSSPMLPPAPHASPPMPGLPPHAPMHLPLHIPGPDPRPRVAYIWRGGLC